MALASASATADVSGVAQPFQCSTCQKRFTRHENLKRHGATHLSPERSVTYPCSYCSTTFSRRDLRRRHLRNKHPEAVHQSVEDGRLSEQLINGNRSDPMEEEQQEEEEEEAQGGGGGGEDAQSQISTTLRRFCPPFPNGTSNFGLPTQVTPDLDLMSNSTIELGLHLFFTHLAHTCPYIHQHTFDVTTAPELLLLAMLSVSMQFADNTTSYNDWKRKGREAYDKAKMLFAEMDEITWSPAVNLQIVQALLLLQLHAVMSVGGVETKYGLKLRSKCVEMVRLSGLTDAYPSQPDTTDNLEDLWNQFARVESLKRTLFGVYQLDAIWYQVLSTPRQMSHLEIKHEMPCSDSLWSASTATAWAHRSLVVGKKPAAKYIATIRNILSPNSDQGLVDLDAYGTLLVILFIMSSVREVSGWSTMTGRVCFVRFEALHTATRYLEPHIGSQKGDQGSLMDVFTQAMWHMAIIDLLLWSPAHIQGVVEYSVDAAIAAASHLCVSQPVATSVESIEPQLRWFLHYLDTTPFADIEPPWITIFAYKASLVAWQLVKAGVTVHVENLGVSDLHEFTDWMRNCFSRRRKWGIGRLILNSMSDLDLAVQNLFMVEL